MKLCQKGCSTTDLKGGRRLQVRAKFQGQPAGASRMPCPVVVGMVAQYPFLSLQYKPSNVSSTVTLAHHAFCTWLPACASFSTSHEHKCISANELQKQARLENLTCRLVFAERDLKDGKAQNEGSQQQHIPVDWGGVLDVELAHDPFGPYETIIQTFGSMHISM